MGGRRSHQLMPQIVAVCGMPGSGKGEFASVLGKEGIPVVSMGDMVRAEVTRREVVESPGIFGEVAADLRAEYGEDVLAVRLADHVDELLQNHDMVLIEGLRGTAERTLFAQRWGSKFSTVAIVADEEHRFARIQNRGRSEDGDYASFLIRDKREIGWGLDALILEADASIMNNDDLNGFLGACDAWLASR